MWLISGLTLNCVRKRQIVGLFMNAEFEITSPVLTLGKSNRVLFLFIASQRSARA
jgi:hypothetical protein